MESLDRYRSIIENWPAFTEACRIPLPITLIQNTLRCTQKQLLEILHRDGITANPIQWNTNFGLKIFGIEKMGSHWANKAGLVHLMEEASMIPPILLDPQPGERILDLCAAPGNKTLLSAFLMKGQGTLIANEFNWGRLTILHSHLERTGVTCVSTYHHNGTNLNAQVGLFDRILCDVPCSCEGTHRKHGKSISWGHPDFRTRLASTQRALLRKALQLCKVGGRIVYSTCTYAPEENECVLDAILREYPGIATLKNARLPNLICEEGLRSWEGQDFVQGMDRCMRVYPHHNDTGGFFVAILEKCANLPAWETVTTASPQLGDAKQAPPEFHGYLDAFDRRFGIRTQEMGVGMFYAKHGDLYCVQPGHQLPGGLPPLSCGLMFLRTTINHPKMPTGMSMQLGPQIQNNVVDLDEQERDAFLHRLPCTLPMERLTNCDLDNGYVFVRHAGFGLGQGLLVQRPDGAELLSMFPKGWVSTAAGGN